MKRVVVTKFGGPEVLEVHEEPLLEPGPGEVRVRLTSIGMNHADLMGRRGEYRLSSGDPPFTPGLEGGGYVDAAGTRVVIVEGSPSSDEPLHMIGPHFEPVKVLPAPGKQGSDLPQPQAVSKRVVLAPDVRMRNNGSLDGSYRSHMIVPADKVFRAPGNLADEALGAIWLSFMTAWGCLIWRQKIQAGQFVAINAASSAVGLAASQVARGAGARVIGLTSSPAKADALREIPEAQFDDVVITHNAEHRQLPWHQDLKKITGGHGVDVFFDAVAAGDYLQTEIRALADGGCIWIYGLLGEPGKLDVSPLIRKNASIRGWVMSEIATDPEAMRRGCVEILTKLSSGAYRIRIAKTFPLEKVREAHEEMERGEHIGKFVLVP